MDFWDGAGHVLDGIGIALSIAALVGGVITLLIAIWGLRRLIRRFRQANTVASSWPRAEATVTAVRLTVLLPGADSTMSPVAEYTFTDGTGRTVTGRDEGLALRRPVVGDRCEVAYDPDDPSVSHPTTGIRGRIGGWAVLFIIVEVLLFGCAALFFWQGVEGFI